MFGETILTFRYLQISLPLLSAEEYVQANTVLGAGLASVMRLPADRTAQIGLYRACLRRVLTAERAGEVDPARAFLLGNLVETYLPLTDAEREALRLQLEQEGDPTMEATELTWADQIDLRTTLRTRREDIKKLLEIRFGRISPQIAAKIDGTDSEEELALIFERAAVAKTEDELG